MYREHDAPLELLQCTWVHRGAAVAHIVPDACLDLMWNGRALLVAGPDTRAVAQRVSGTIHGVRFKTGCAPAVLGVPASALRDARVELDAPAWVDRLQREDPAHVLCDFVRAHRSEPDRLVLALVERLRAVPSLRTATLARELGVSERQLNRRCTDAVGYGPKFLARVLRMQSFVRAVRRDEQSLAALAVQLGFSDQAHLGHEASELYGTTPARLRA
jgi:AraC-like DNA-binding protein